MAKKTNKKIAKKPVEKEEEVKSVEVVEKKTEFSKEEKSDYQPGFLSNLLATKKIDSKPIFQSENNDKVIEANSEDERSWEPFNNDDMDDNLAEAFENMQKNPEKWMNRLENQLNDSSEEESSEEEPENSEEEEIVESEEQEEEERDETIISKMIPDNTVYVNGISWSYDEESFRAFFKEVGEIKTLFLVRQNNGKISGYGAIEFDSPEKAKAAIALNNKEYLGRPLGLKKFDGEESLHKKAVKKDKRMKKKAKKEKQEKKRPFKKNVKKPKKH